MCCCLVRPCTRHDRDLRVAPFRPYPLAQWAMQVGSTLLAVVLCSSASSNLAERTIRRLIVRPDAHTRAVLPDIAVVALYHHQILVWNELLSMTCPTTHHPACRHNA